MQTHRLKRVKPDTAQRGAPSDVQDVGVNHEIDALKALTPGASAVLVSRPFVYAAATGSRADVRRAIELLDLEVTRALGLLGVNSPNEMNSPVLCRDLYHSSPTERSRHQAGPSFS